MENYATTNLNYSDYNLYSGHSKGAVQWFASNSRSVLENSRICLRKMLTYKDENSLLESVSIHCGSTKLGSFLRVDV